MRAVLLAFAASVAFVTPSRAAPDSLSYLYACTSIADVAAKAACYDAATAKLQTAVKAGQLTIIENVEMQKLQTEVFGFEAPTLPAVIGKSSGAKPITTVETKIAKVSRGADTVFTLENGQIWRQVDTTGNPGLRTGLSVRIERRVLGSYLLIPSDGGGAVRVQRVS
jgi:hypothetical protein